MVSVINLEGMVNPIIVQNTIRALGRLKHYLLGAGIYYILVSDVKSDGTVLL